MSTVLGVKDLSAVLENLAKYDFQKPLRKSVLLVQATARNYVPVNHEELKGSIFGEVQGNTGIVYTNKEYAEYVEFGTGPVGAADHAGISPEVSPAYSQTDWWFHESQIDPRDAEKYHFFHIDTEDGRFYRSYGQAAQPYMYPALKDNEENIEEIFNDELEGLL